jgi:hypothetical protein
MTAWIGLDKSSYGDWRWLDGSVYNSTWNGWSQGQPQGGGSAIMKDTGSWTREDSGQQKHYANYVCELGVWGMYYLNVVYFIIK